MVENERATFAIRTWYKIYKRNEEGYRFFILQPPDSTEIALYTDILSKLLQ